VGSKSPSQHPIHLPCSFALEDLLSADTVPAVRLGAARTMAKIALHQHDADTILRTLDEIEQRQ
jgi:hypothetical protein